MSFSPSPHNASPLMMKKINCDSFIIFLIVNLFYLFHRSLVGWLALCGTNVLECRVGPIKCSFVLWYAVCVFYECVL